LNGKRGILNKKPVRTSLQQAATFPQIPRAKEPAVGDNTKVQFKADSAFATVWPTHDGRVRLSCLGGPAQGSVPLSIFEPANSTFDLTLPDLKRIGVDISRFLRGRRDGFVVNGRRS
jgi:hypothetical protein